MTQLDEKPCARRRLMTAGIGGIGLGLAGICTNSAALAAVNTGSVGLAKETIAGSGTSTERRLRLANAHTWEKLDLVYWANGDYIPEAMREISHLMRDHRVNRSKAIDPKLIDQLFVLVSILETQERVHILSGYRTPETNAALRARSKGVAKYSLHMEARAMDLNIPGIRAKDIQLAAIAMKAGGVGYYESSGFVHIDTGKLRSW